MSRDPTYTINEHDLSFADGRFYVSFKADKSSETVRLNSSCLGNTIIKKLQVEDGDTMHDFVQPKVTTQQPFGLAQQVKEIDLQLKDPNSDLWGRIKLNNKAMLVEYGNKEMASAIAQSAEQILLQVKSIDDERYSKFEQTLNGIKQTVKSESVESARTQLASMFDSRISGLDGKYSRLSQTIDSLSSRLDDGIGNYSTLSQKVSGIDLRVSNAAKDVSRLSQTAQGLQLQITNANQNYSSLSQTVGGLQTTVHDNQSNATSRINQLSDLISTKVTKGDVETTIAQSYDKIAFAIRDKLPASKMTGSEIISAINLDRSGVKITGKNITLDGNSYISNAVIKDAHIANMDAGKINTGYLNASRIAAEAITGDKIKMDYAFFNKLTANEGYFRTLFAKNIFTTSVQAVTMSASKITGGVLSATNGASRWDLNSANIDFNRDATINFNSKNNALVRKDGTHTAFVHFSNATPKGYRGSALYASIGITSSGDGIDSASSGRFCGVRFFRYAEGLQHTAKVDQAEIYGDDIVFSDDFNIDRGFKMRPSLMPKMVDLNKMYQAILALGRCWLHANNTAWSWNFDTRSAIIAEYNAHINNL
ncbi:gp58-like family protein [Streptococcus pyogenes]|uniref:gp58-like family protein n=1 Tax=Streptococcus pyogenes TaxID=1314 RepID=UPI00109C0FCC|nr:gp58-like family protein [Streptococcus pyogenes]VGQ20605.1 gp58-like family protein [Streptococcus pyogenes]VGQ51779.1 gp58-like family protein [Streptococcus pyogenes]VGU68174.1 gp58-like family protein [Streptococcus pyogenes]VGV44748.1 gp58-like family protein [Streptococcus pyogenes]VHB11461.1 gp58-like family protein [Streptococcus pyogenes]